jgi:hypothetical protein
MKMRSLRYAVVKRPKKGLSSENLGGSNVVRVRIKRYCFPVWPLEKFKEPSSFMKQKTGFSGLSQKKYVAFLFK